MREKVAAFIEKKRLVQHGDTIVVAVSGGADSVALLHILVQLRAQYGYHLVACHVDHMFRGAESAAEQQHVAELCRQWGVPFEGCAIDVKALAEEQRKSAQQMARECRYFLLEEAVKLYEATILMTAHHGDDQVETMVMRFVRGSAFDGYAGIKAKQRREYYTLVRPLLTVTKADIVAYCEAEQLIYCEDPSNMDSCYTRNRFRQTILPFLQQENKQVAHHMQLFSEQLLEDEQFIHNLMLDRWTNVVKEEAEEYFVLAVEPFRLMAKSLQRRMIHLILNYLYENDRSVIKQQHVNDLIELMEHTHPSHHLHLPNSYRAVRDYEYCRIGHQLPQLEQYEHYIAAEVKLSLPHGELMARLANEAEMVDGASFCVSFDQLPLTVRTRRNGDRMSLKGMDGTRKLKDIFIDYKIPQYLRDSWPVVCDRNGTILWLPHLKKSTFEASNHTKPPHLVLHYKKQGNF